MVAAYKIMFVEETGRDAYSTVAIRKTVTISCINSGFGKWNGEIKLRNWKRTVSISLNL